MTTLGIKDDLHTLISWLVWIGWAIDNARIPNISLKTRVITTGFHSLLFGSNKSYIIIESKISILIKVGYWHSNRSAIHGSKMNLINCPFPKIHLVWEIISGARAQIFCQITEQLWLARISSPIDPMPYLAFIIKHHILYGSSTNIEKWNALKEAFFELELDMIYSTRMIRSTLNLK